MEKYSGFDRSRQAVQELATGSASPDRLDVLIIEPGSKNPKLVLCSTMSFEVVLEHYGDDEQPEKGWIGFSLYR